ncbi:hypothetical protein CAMGR0001_0005 [Campylobacter gracilis RM3268]|uniref:Uncharacterized protein n=1 Tax=Campylobacter gracilis RM3268 TaxID=553220 RepID=C8PI24_9BACT|nr:hypothetical protein CAMGR0001_0005 [Campylobacter gracilis RM3268]
MQDDHLTICALVFLGRAITSAPILPPAFSGKGDRSPFCLNFIYALAPYFAKSKILAIFSRL